MRALELEMEDPPLTVVNVSGGIEDGEVKTEKMAIEPGEGTIELDEPIEFSEDPVKEVLEQEFFGRDPWPNPCEVDWEKYQSVGVGTIKWEIMEYLWEHQPATSPEVEDAIGLDSTGSAYISRLKDKNLVACIGKEGRTGVNVLTHLGVKELAEHHGLRLEGLEESGLASLYDSAGQGPEVADGSE